ncbi:hypothetical protein BPOR_0236g00100 [Botrytis porri]|uniref:Uncharacterized protein n=1 Tax=Botrytis porri TaxID=87229 RepID=A0A4Z1KMG9_9HELO|nr:hypothetical protein BPOR_0236g00100 [Botrytis porri]
MNVFRFTNCQNEVESRAKAQDFASKFPDPNTLVLYSTLTFCRRFCHDYSQAEIDGWTRNILWHARTVRGTILRSPSLLDSKEALSFKILERFQKYFLPQYEHFMRALDLSKQVKPRIVFNMNPYCLEELPDFIIEVGFELWRLDEDGHPVYKLCRCAFFAQEPLTISPSQFLIMSSESALAEKIMQQLYCDGSEDFFPAINGQYIMTRNPERSALVKPPTSTPKLSAKEPGLWINYFRDPSAPRLCPPPTSVTKEDAEHFNLLQTIKNYYMSHQVEITDNDTIIHVLHTYSEVLVRSEYRTVDCFRLSNIKNSGFPNAIVALYHVKTPEIGEPYFDRALFVQEPLKKVLKNSPAKEQQLKARFLSIAEDLEEEISRRFYVPSGQNGGPLYGQYVQKEELGSVDIKQVDQGRGRYKSTAVI